MTWRLTAPLALAVPLLLGAGVPDLTEPERSALSEGEPVSRWDGAEALGVIDIDADRAAVLSAVLDLTARINDQRAIKAVEIYRRAETPERLWAKWTLSVMTIGVVFHIVYEVDRDAGICTYWLDETQENDVKSSTGSYEVVPRGTGSRLVYRSASETGTNTPEWVRKWLAIDSLKVQLQSIKRRAEGNS